MPLDLEKKLAELKAEHGEDGQKQLTAPKKKPAVRKKVAKPTTKGRSSRTTEEKAQAFAHAYVAAGCNATEAYKQAISPTCKDTTATANGHKWLSKAQVQKYLAPLLEALMEKNEVNAEWVLARWKEQADGSPLDYFQITPDGDLGQLDLTAINEAQRRNLKEIRVTENTRRTAEGEEYTTRQIHVKVYDAQKAVEMFAKYLGLLTRSLEEEEVERIGDLIELGVKRIRASKSLDAWQTIDAEFSEVG